MRGKNQIKVLSFLMALVMLFGVIPVEVFALGDNEITVSFTLSKYGSFVQDKNGNDAVMESVKLEGKETYTLVDVFDAFHKAYYNGENGFLSDPTSKYGTALTKLWGDESGNFGYYINGGMANSLDDAVKDGDVVEAFIYENSYPDTEAYSAFSEYSATVNVGEEYSLTLKHVSGYDSTTWAPIMSGCEGATITVNGEETEIVTSSEGTAKLSFNKTGTYVISAKKTKVLNENIVTAITSPVCVVTVKPVETNVVVWAQSENTFLLTPQSIAVSSDTAEKYGYTDEVSGVSALDVLLAANEVYAKNIMGGELTKDNLSSYVAGGATYITKMFGISGGSSFSVNGEYPYDPNSTYGSYGYTGYLINQSPIEEGDEVGFFFYEDSYYMDYFTYFEQDGKRVNEITVNEGESVELALNGFMYMFGSLNSEDRVKRGAQKYIEDAQIALLDATGSLNPISEKVTDENGKVTLKFEDAGTYYVSAVTDPEETNTYIVSPLLKVNVKGAEISDLSISVVNNLTKYESLLLNGTNDENVPESVPKYSQGISEYSLSALTDARTGLYFWYTTPMEGSQVEFSWENRSTGATGSRILTKATDSGTTFSKKFLSKCITAGQNVIKMTVTPPESSGFKARTYTFNIDVEPTLKGLTASADGTNVYFDKTVSSAEENYTLTVPKTSKEVTFDVELTFESYNLKFNGEENSTLKLDGIDKVEIEVSVGGGENLVSKIYTVNLNKVDNLAFKPVVKTEGAVIKVYDQKGVEVAPEDDGSYLGMFSSQQYSYTVTKYGYVGVTETVDAANLSPEITLVKAEESKHEDVGAQWKNFRNSDVNMGITSAKTPTDPEYTSLLWNVKLGSGWSAAPSVQIIVDDALVVMSNKNIYKLSLETGEILATGAMEQVPSYGYTPPTYAEGLIICPLGNGTVQAFDAKTLESVWVYQDNLKGQSLSPISYSDGYVYTGFWNSETKDANFVCISVTDEDPSATNERKAAVWKYTSAGGFYWAGSVCVGDYVLVGTDDGDSGSTGTSKVLSFNKYTGELVSEVALGNAGDQRSSLAYDSESGKIFFTTKGGYLFSAKVDSKTGIISELKGNVCVEGAQSTSTPVVYKGNVYFGCGAGFNGGEGCCLVVADAETLKTVGTVNLLGDVKASMLLSTAYEDEGYLYLYATYNAMPGGVSLIKVKNNPKSSDDLTLVELYDAAGFSQYCITSMICDEDGNLYYKNDSSNVFKIGVPDIGNVEKLIDSISDPVTLDDEAAVVAARNAYEALSDEDKKDFNENNAERLKKLEDAEKTISDLKVKKAESLIGKIPSDISLGDERTIQAARDYYDGLSDSEKTKVSNYSKLTDAEDALKKLKDSQPKGGTKSVSVTINGVTYQVSEATKKAIEAIEAIINPKDSKDKLPEDFSQLAPKQEKAILEAAKLYNALTSDEKLFAVNYPEFEESVLKKLGENYHYDEPTGTDARDNEDENLPWYVKLNVTKAQATDKQLKQLSNVLGENAKLLSLYKVSFTNMLTGEDWTAENLINIKLKTSDKGELDSYCMVHMDDEGNIEYIKGELFQDDGTIEMSHLEFANEGVAAFEGTWEELFGENSNVAQNTKVWPWAAAGGVSLAGVLWLILGKKKKDEEEEE